MLSTGNTPDSPTRMPPPEFDTPEGLVSLVQDLVRIPSVTGDEAAVMGFAEQWLRRAGLEIRVVEGEGEGEGEGEEEREESRPNLVASLGPEGGPLYVMNGHMDTVPVPEDEPWEFPPFGSEVREGRLYGRGAFDMKGACGAMMWAAARLAERKEDLAGRFQLHLVCDEEKGGTHGSRVIAQAIEGGALPTPDGIFSGELSWLRMRTAERGIFRFKINFRGRSAHTFNSRVDGLNAIAVAARGVLTLEQHIDRFHPAVGYPIISINVIEGGTVANQVPSSCTVLVDRRLVPGETSESVLEEVGQALDGLEETTDDGRHLPVVYELITADEDLMPVVPASMTDPEDPFVQALWGEAEDVLGYRPEPFTDWAGATDARWFRRLGIPVVILGPTGAGAHGADEYVDVAALGAISEIYHRTLARLLGL